MNAQIYHHRFMDSLGARLRRKRREKGWTQEQLAIKAGTNQAVIQKIENGKSLRPRKINEIAKVLEVNPAWLMFGDRSANFSEEAMKVAEAWEGVPEPARSRLKEEILKQVQKGKG
jgi:transcriptional regulator with XRE-family HTH domain